MALAGGGGGGHVRGRRRPRKRPLSEINVTPLVDVMLVLLIIFMVSAPLLTTGVEVELLVDTLGNCPGDYLYTAFDMLRPAARAALQVRLIDQLHDDAFVKSTRMFDRWASDILPLAGEYFRETTKALMWDNRLLNGTMAVAGRPVDLGRITVPFLHVAALHDHIVPTAASAPLVGMIGSVDKDEVVLKGGHVSLVAGGNAIRRLWPKLVQWLAPRSL